MIYQRLNIRKLTFICNVIRGSKVDDHRSSLCETDKIVVQILAIMAIGGDRRPLAFLYELVIIFSKEDNRTT